MENSFIENICNHLFMEDSPEGDGYFFVCEKRGTTVDINDCFNCKERE